MRFQREVEGLEEFADSDLIVVADGINSRIREKYKEHFQPSVDLRPNKFTWLGSTKPLDAFKYFFRETPEGVIARALLPVRARPLDLGDRDRRADLAQLRLRQAVRDRHAAGDRARVRRGARRPPADRQPLAVAQLSQHHQQDLGAQDNAVLVGDAKATAHFSIGSGTKLAMEDAIALFEAFRQHPEVKKALTLYDTARREEVEKTQHAANVSLAWFEHLKRYWGMEPRAVRLRRDVALQADHLGEPRAARPGVRARSPPAGSRTR